MTAIATGQLTDGQRLVLLTLRALYHETCIPVSMAAIARACAVPASTARVRIYHLKDQGLIRRVGRRGSWVPFYSFEEESLILSALRAIRRDTGRCAGALALSLRCSYSKSTATRRLRYLEMIGIVERQGVRKGWLPVADPCPSLLSAKGAVGAVVDAGAATTTATTATARDRTNAPMPLPFSLAS